ncbi:MAG: hypothetical protein PWQ62_160 [Candidatus Methanomethylophilaceae archaeon]|nr:hypothetical protein [Candidatus Methanomethylophilaceae archaeon]
MHRLSLARGRVASQGVPGASGQSGLREQPFIGRPPNNRPLPIQKD